MEQVSLNLLQIRLAKLCKVSRILKDGQAADYVSLGVLLFA
jgi:hypothetical protein